MKNFGEACKRSSDVHHAVSCNDWEAGGTGAISTKFPIRSFGRGHKDPYRGQREGTRKERELNENQNESQQNTHCIVSSFLRKHQRWVSCDEQRGFLPRRTFNNKCSQNEGEAVGEGKLTVTRVVHKHLPRTFKSFILRSLILISRILSSCSWGTVSQFLSTVTRPMSQLMFMHYLSETAL